MANEDQFEVLKRFLAAFLRAGGTIEQAAFLAADSDLMRRVVDIAAQVPARMPMTSTSVVTTGPAAVVETVEHLVPADLPTWRTVRRGVYKTSDAYFSAMHTRGYLYGPHLVLILREASWSQDEGDESLVKLPDRSLGFTSPYTLDELLAAAAKIGLHPLDTDVGAGLREQYSDQLSTEWLVVAMLPVMVGDNRSVFTITKCRGKMWLNTEHGELPGGRFGPDHVWVFSRRDPLAQG